MPESINLTVFFTVSQHFGMSRAQTPPTRGEGLVTQAQFLGLVEVLKTCNCKRKKSCKFKNESHHSTNAR